MHSRSAAGLQMVKAPQRSSCVRTASTGASSTQCCAQAVATFNKTLKSGAARRPWRCCIAPHVRSAWQMLAHSHVGHILEIWRRSSWIG